MSFSQEVKAEIGQNILHPCCQRAQLAAFIQLCSTLSISSGKMTLNIRIENPTTAKRIWVLLKELYGVETELSVIKKMNLKKNNIYYIRVLGEAKKILENLYLLKDGKLVHHPPAQLVKKECCARAYLAGSFLATGSVNSPQKSNYHLEMVANDEEHGQYVIRIMKRFDLPAKYIKRRNQHVAYLKQSEKISDFLRCIGAHNAVMDFENHRIQRDFKNNFIRLDNCELANEVKTLNASKKQLEDIQKIIDKGRFEMMDEKLQEIANLRIEFEDYSLIELCEEYKVQYKKEISKSGMKHRFSKIKELANMIQEK